MRKRALPDLRPVRGEFSFGGGHGIRKELQDVLRWDPVLRLAAF
jgi:hypothetical protein